MAGKFEFQRTSASEMFDQIEFLLRDLVVLQSDADYHALTLWIAQSYCVAENDYAPRLAIWSPEKRCGKSLLLDVIGNLVKNPRLTSSISAAALYRTIEGNEDLTVLIDESDTIFGKGSDSERSEALRGVLNAGFKRGQVVTRCEGNSFTPRDYSVFCNVVIAGIGKDAIPETVKDRSILIEMRRKFSNEKITEFESDEVETIFLPHRKALENWYEMHRGQIRTCRPLMPEYLNSRAKDMWKPLVKVANLAGGDWVEKAFSSARALSEKPEDEDELSLPLQLLSDIRNIWRGERISSKELVFELLNLEESPWRYQPYGFNQHTLAKILKNYSIRPTSDGSHRGYRITQFIDAWQRYLPPVEGVKTVSNVNQPDTPDTSDGFSKQSSMKYSISR